MRLLGLWWAEAGANHDGKMGEVSGRWREGLSGMLSPAALATLQVFLLKGRC